MVRIKFGGQMKQAGGVIFSSFKCGNCLEKRNLMVMVRIQPPLPRKKMSKKKKSKNVVA